MKRFYLSLIVFFVVLMGLLSIGPPCLADISLKSDLNFIDNITVGGGTELYFFPTMKNVAGVKDNDYQFIDGFFTLNTTVKLKGNVEFKFGGVSFGTYGCDYFNIGNEDRDDFDVDEAYIKFNQILNQPVSLTFGRQQIFVEKGFLMSEGNLDYTTALYSNAEKASPFAIRMDGTWKFLSVTAYGETIATDSVLKAGGKGDNIDAYGLNLNAAISDQKHIYAGVIEWNGVLGATEDDYQTYYLGTDLSWGALNFQGEYAIQRGDNTDYGVVTDQEAYAFFAFLKYTFQNVKFTPWIQGGAYSFSGDDPGTSKNEGFGTMTSVGPDWGMFCPGEIMGEQYYGGRNNYTDYLLQVAVCPRPDMQIRLMFHHVVMEEQGNYTDDKLYDELNLVVEYFPNEHLYCGVMIGVADPKGGHEQSLGLASGSAETAYGIMPYLCYRF